MSPLASVSTHWTRIRSACAITCPCPPARPRPSSAPTSWSGTRRWSSRVESRGGCPRARTGLTCAPHVRVDRALETRPDRDADLHELGGAAVERALAERRVAEGLVGLDDARMGVAEA